MASATDPYPAGLRVTSPRPMARWRPLVQWLLAVPHLIILYGLNALSGAVAFVSWFVILFTGRLPSGLAGIQALFLRYQNRTYAYAGFLVADYPPFAFGMTGPDPGTYGPVAVDTDPALEERNRLTTFFRLLLVLPHLIVLGFLGIGAAVVWFVGFFAVLFTGRWPDGLQEFLVGYLRWTLRVTAYYVLLTDRYPPFRLG